MPIFSLRAQTPPFHGVRLVSYLHRIIRIASHAVNLLFQFLFFLPCDNYRLMYSIMTKQKSNIFSMRSCMHDINVRSRSSVFDLQV